MEHTTATERPSSALHTDHYELTMAQAALASGRGEHRAVFELFARRLPAGQRFGIVTGTGRVLDELAGFRFSESEVEWLVGQGVVPPSMADWLVNYRFSGDVYGYPEGELYFPGSPLFTVEGTFAEAVVLETVMLSTMNFDTSIATAAFRMVQAAGGRTLLDMHTRRTHADAAPAAARAAYIAGFDATSNLVAGKLYGVPTKGTAAHAFTMAFPSELEAFEAQIAAFGPKTTLLVDTYDIAQGIRNAVRAGGPGLGAIRIDSGDPGPVEESYKARAQLDRLGNANTKITVSGGLDESTIYRIDHDGAPVDVIGVGTEIVVGAAARFSPGFVFKLVAIADSLAPGAPLRSVAKRCGAKSSVGGRKHAWRTYDARYGVRTALAEVISTDPAHYTTLASHDAAWRPLQVPLVRHGEIVAESSARLARDHFEAVRAELPDDAFIADEVAGPIIPTVYGGGEVLGAAA
jgi:nicotinate phosphoribosyltransferase